MKELIEFAGAFGLGAKRQFVLTCELWPLGIRWVAILGDGAQYSAPTPEEAIRLLIDNELAMSDSIPHRELPRPAFMSVVSGEEVDP